MKINSISGKKIIIWTVIVLLIIFIKVFSLNKPMVENWYSTGFYIYLSLFFRFLFGWIPFSLGDILYFLAGCGIVYKLLMYIKIVFQKAYTRRMLGTQLSKTVLLAAIIYIVFNLFWGINYNRTGIVHQLNLDSLKYDTSDLLIMQSVLLEKVNKSKTVILQNNLSYPIKAELFKQARKCYEEAEKKIPFLRYRNQSVKSSLYGWWGNYMGFMGYYNPFTGEAQINTTVPLFLQPDIAVHEMGHQLGYAKEDEASFAGYLAVSHSSDIVFQYSNYLSLYLYTNRDVFYFDSTKAKESLNSLLPAIKKDLQDWRDFDLAHQGYLEPAITWMYNKYLKLNEQPKGMRSYNQVIALLIAYYKKYGII